MATSVGAVTTLAGLPGKSGTVDGTGSAVQFAGPWGVAVDSAANVYVADYHTIRKGIPTSSVPPPMLGPPVVQSNRFVFGLSGLPGLAIDVESSIDLTNWQVAGTYVLEEGTNSFVSPIPNTGNQFYRASVR
jgi:hypothetical protein